MANPIQFSTDLTPRFTLSSRGFRKLADAGGVPVWQFEGAPKESPFFYLVNSVEIDFDGAPNAYGPRGIHSATGSYYGITGPLQSLTADGGAGTFENGRPKEPYGYLSQAKPGDPWHGKEQTSGPWKGFYISKTALENRWIQEKETDPGYFVDATSIPYVVLPVEYKEHGATRNEDFGATGLRIGDIVLAINAKTGKRVFAIFADTKKKRRVTEISPKLIEMLGFPMKVKHGRPTCDQRHPFIVYIAFPKSGKGEGYIPSVSDIQNMGAYAAKDAMEEYQLADRIAERFPDFPMIRSAFLDLGGTHAPLKFGRGQCW